MLFQFIDLFDSDFALYMTLTAATLLALVIGIGFHEACHAFTANALGDTLPARQGRLTFNPLAHLDPWGTVMMLAVGFGWGKPVQFQPYGLKISPKNASFLVALAGPMSNFVAAGLLALPIKLGWVPYVNPLEFRVEVLPLVVTDSTDYVGVFLTTAVFLNIILGVFNLIPIPPLDGFKVALGLLPEKMAMELQKLDQYGFAFLMVIIFLIPAVTNYNPLSDIMWPPVEFLLETLTGID